MLAFVIMLDIATAGTPELIANRNQEAHGSTWYGWQIMTTDAAIVGGMYASRVGGPEDPTLTPFLFGHLTISPMLHIWHRNYLHAGTSLIARAALPALGYGLYSKGPEGLLVGYLLAVGLDAALALEANPASSAPQDPQPKLLPTVAINQGEASVGLWGVF